MPEQRLQDRIADDVRRYVELRVDDAKLAAVEGLSSLAGSAIGLVIFMFLLNLALVLFTFVFVYLIHLLTHSWVWAAVIMGVIYVGLGVWVFKKPVIFRDMMVRVFAPMFFCPKKYEEDDDE